MFDHFSWPGGTYICSGILASFHTTVYNCKVLFQLVLPQWQSKHYCIYMLKIWRLILKIIHINKEKSKLLCSSNLHFYLNLLSTRKYLLQFTWWQYLEPKLKFWLWGWSRLIQSLFLLDVIFGKAKSSISHRLTSVLLPFNERDLSLFRVCSHRKRTRTSRGRSLHPLTHKKQIYILVKMVQSLLWLVIWWCTLSYFTLVIKKNDHDATGTTTNALSCT